ncbi:hypothetical protein PLESTB_001019600 [Pleodorina starrii]|uniref:PPPDE domain-containing protein n=1 Tax=Pleodorina starrii TaxID=330485 RepID=A0A9W6BPV8_9CHLO|nr:hypothetical protein PLESTM_001188200 [Pleodorina starrii]GLC55730.1 hypothetical protein PLESTB_001019600 [Pleodorina starrii]GLC65477.1 hypothetical protein PLESTF_000297700 [Pleodorina starrii]
MQVSLNVYDVTNTANENTNGMITRLNSITRELNFGGVFHGAVQLEEVEWSFGYCESGSGVYCCRARSNSLYTFREHIELGVTRKTKQEVKEIIARFKRTWPGTSYDLLQRNCCHFCEQLCAALEVPSPPAWLNRFAQGVDATVKFTNEASALAKRVGSNISSTAQQSATWLRELSQRVMSQISVPSSTDDAAAAPAPGDDGSAVASSPLYARSISPGSCSSDPGGRREGGSMGRLTSRLRQFGAGGSGSSAAVAGLAGGAAASLPASTPSSSCDLASGAGGASTPAPSSSQQPLAATLRQKWQELEASAGDGTKQFLFGLIKTRQTRLEEDDSMLGGGGGDGGGEIGRPSSSMTPGSSGRTAAGHGPMGQSSAGAAVRAREGAAEPTQAPALQVISHSLLPPDVVGGPPPALAAEVEALSQAAQGVERLGLALGPGTAGVAVAATSGVVGSEAGRLAPPEQHLLDM